MEEISLPNNLSNLSSGKLASSLGSNTTNPYINLTTLNTLSSVNLNYITSNYYRTASSNLPSQLKQVEEDISGTIEATYVFRDSNTFDAFNEGLTNFNTWGDYEKGIRDKFRSTLLSKIGLEIESVKKEIASCEKDLSVHIIYLEGQLLGLYSVRDMLSKY